MTDQFGFSDLECKIIKAQIERRARAREEWLKMRTDPCKNSQQAGYAFDPAIQRFLSMKDTQLERFQSSTAAIKFGVIAMAPMFIMGYIIWTTRMAREHEIRCGRLKYKDRLFKFQ